MSKVKITVGLDLPTREQSSKSRKQHCDESVEKKVNDAILLMELGEDSAKHWSYLIRLNNRLAVKWRKSTINEREEKILRKIQPVLGSYMRGTNYNIDLIPTILGEEDKDPELGPYRTSKGDTNA
jgi:hypothetical protein